MFRGRERKREAAVGVRGTLGCSQSLSRVQLFATPWTVAHQAPLSMNFPGKNTGVGCHFLLQTLGQYVVKKECEDACLGVMQHYISPLGIF